MGVLIVAALVAVLAYRRRRCRIRDTRCGARPTAGPQRPRYGALVAAVFILGCQVMITTPPAFAVDCGQAPSPQRPGSGLVGSFDYKHPVTRSEPTLYDQYGYAGMVWHTFETNCGPLHSITSSIDSTGNNVGNGFFNAAKAMVGATNGLHYAINNNDLLAPIYHAVEQGSRNVYQNIYVQILGVCALLLALVMLRSVWRGNLASVSRRALYALAALWLAASSFGLLGYLGPFDSAIVQITTKIQNGFIGDDTNDALPQDLHTYVVYNNWLRGEFGASDAPQAESGKSLLDAQAFTWDQMQKSYETDPAVIDGKRAAYTDLAKKMGPATDNFTGSANGRIGSGLLALVESIIYASFQLIAKITILLAQVILRLLIITAPLLGAVALLRNEILRTVVKVAGTVMVNLLIISVLAGLQALLLRALFASEIPVFQQIQIAAVSTVVIFAFGRPVRRLGQVVRAPVVAVGSRLPRFRRATEITTGQETFFRQIQNAQASQGVEQEGRPTGSRPEEQGTSTPTSSVLTTDNVSVDSAEVEHVVPSRLQRIANSISHSIPSKPRLVWDFIKPTQEVWEDTVIPRSFEMTLEDSEKIWVAPRAAKHILEVMPPSVRPEIRQIIAQIHLESLRNAVLEAFRGGVKYETKIFAEGWELIFSEPRTGPLPTLKHAQTRKVS